MFDQDRNFKLTMINMLRGLVKKMNSIHKQIGNFSREIESIKTSQTEMSEKIFFNVSEIKKSFIRLIIKLGIFEDRVNLKIDQ